MYLLPAQSYMPPTESGRTEKVSQKVVPKQHSSLSTFVRWTMYPRTNKNSPVYYRYIDSKSISNYCTYCHRSELWRNRKYSKCRYPSNLTPQVRILLENGPKNEDRYPVLWRVATSIARTPSRSNMENISSPLSTTSPRHLSYGHC